MALSVNTCKHMIRGQLTLVMKFGRVFPDLIWELRMNAVAKGLIAFLMRD